METRGVHIDLFVYRRVTGEANNKHRGVAKQKMADIDEYS
jgi:hypothetical protein